jgi:hypothetical protein
MYMMNSMLKLEMKTGICRIDWAILQRFFFDLYELFDVNYKI